MNRQDSSHKPIQDLLTHLDSATSTGAGTEYFIPRQEIDTFFQNTSHISSILDALFPGQEHPVRPDFIAHDCVIIFCILLRLGLGEYIRYFSEHHSLWDENLPFQSRPTKFPQVPEDPDFWEKFRREQWHFSPATLRRIHSVGFEDECILPFLTKEELKVSTPTNTAHLYKVTVHSQYDNMRYEDEIADSHREYALKTYRGKHAAQYYQTEIQNFDMLCLRNREAAPGLIRFYCGFRHRGTYNLLLEYANGGTLEDLFQNGDAPSSGDEILTFWKTFLEPIKALVSIHELDVPNGVNEVFEVFQGWHQDVKPSNILVHRKDIDKYGTFQFRLADLGLSHFTRMTSDGDPDAIDAKGTRTYGAPEIHRRSAFDVTRRIYTKRAVDIWSLGCVMLEICVWISRGRGYLKAFRSSRESENDAKETTAGDCFHDGRLPEPSVLTVVQEEPSRLWADRRISDFLTHRVLEIVKRMLRSDRPRARPSASSVLADMENAIQDAEKDTKRHYTSSELQSPKTPSSGGLPYHNALHSLHIPGHSEPDLSGFAGQRASLDLAVAAATPSGDEAVHISKGLMGSSVYPSALLGSPESSSQPNNGFVRKDTSPQSPEPGRRSQGSKAPFLSLEEAIEWRKGSSKWTKTFGGKKLPKIEQFRPWFDNRDHIFLIDDSKSMEPYKDHIEMLLDPLAYIVKKGDPDGIEIHYTVSSATLTTKYSSELIQNLSRHRFEGKTDISDRLHTILQKRQVELKTQSMARAASVYIFTNGVWERGKDAKSPIREMIKVLKQKKYTRKQIGIQFISYGDDTEGLARLDELDEFGKHPEVDFDMVDTEKHDRNLLKMLLGAIDKTFDDVYNEH